MRREVERRKHLRGVLSYDDLLSRLADALEADDAPARQRMRQRWEVVLVDEFQDTDPVQWEVLDRAFSAHATLVLIGDPKQAIYAFRGGDVVTYLRAAGTATTRHTLATNWRSDAGLVGALQALTRGAELGDPEITVLDVEAHHRQSRLVGAPGRRTPAAASAPGGRLPDRPRRHGPDRQAAGAHRRRTSPPTWRGCSAPARRTTGSRSAPATSRCSSPASSGSSRSGPRCSPTGSRRWWAVAAA